MNRHIALGVCFALLTINSAFAAEKSMVACISRKSGAVTVRSRCTSAERKLSMTYLNTAAQTGPRGEKGDRGEQGLQGFQGIKGDRGEQGLVGVQGIRGEKGDRGDVGPIGLTGAVGATGAQGIQGLTGAVGPQGPRGLSGFSQIPSGTTIYGAIGGDYYNTVANAEWGSTTSLYGIPPSNFSNEVVVVRNNANVDNECGGTCVATEDLQFNSYCNGSVEAPSASPGWLCVYPTQDTNARDVRAIALPNGNGAYGFTVRWVAANAGRTIFRGVWAYTAP